MKCHVVAPNTRGGLLFLSRMATRGVDVRIATDLHRRLKNGQSDPGTRHLLRDVLLQIAH